MMLDAAASPRTQMALRAFRLKLIMRPRVSPAAHSGRPIRVAPTVSHTGDV